MIRCIVTRCTWTNKSLQRLYDHLNRFHSDLQVYECNVGDCTRKFNVKHSFYRHFKTHYHETSNMETMETAETIEISSSSNTSDFTTANAESYRPASEHDQPIHTSDPSNTINRQPEDDLLYTTKLNALIQQMQHTSVDFVLKYLNTNIIPRKIVFDIQKDVKSKIIDPLSEAIDIMGSLGLVTEQGKNIFSQMLSAMKEVESEYKYLARLKELDLYVDPKQFVISDELHPGIVHNEQMMDNNPVTGNVRQLHIISIYSFLLKIL